ncbi:hypothetical protein OIO90_006416 [Microbotryomycetes sp. JL221]|nr:hypothetical protein OIO90_006416 [Microbotryomycetes sp. JL221]
MTRAHNDESTTTTHMRHYTYLTNQPLDDGPLVSKLVQTDSNDIIWTKIRKLTTTEIVDYIADSSNNVQWTCHKPLQGWYLALTNRSNEFINLVPPRSQTSFIKGQDVVLEFELECLVVKEDEDEDEHEQQCADQVTIDVERSNDDVAVDIESTTTTKTRTKTCQFKLIKGRNTTNVMKPSLFNTVINWVQNGFSSQNDWYWTCVLSPVENNQTVENEEIEIMKFQDVSSSWSTSTKGNLSINTKLIQNLGIEISFLISIGFVFQEFLQEIQAYKVASS